MTEVCRYFKREQGTRGPPGERRTCLSVARWRDGQGRRDQGPGVTDNRFTVPQLGYQP